MRRLFLIFLLLCVAPTATASESVSEWLELFRPEFSVNALAKRSQWLALLHYREEALGTGFISQVDDENFFLSPQGVSDASAELVASLESLLQPESLEHAQCRFPARWMWLKQQLQIDDSHDVPCPALDRWLASISRDSLTLVFPAMYLNNPGSSFGHTFLRFDNQDSDLLSHALNYAALYDPDDNLLNYAWKGIAGGYLGGFNLRRYFATVQEYSNIENRDIWEYRLDYSTAEIELLLRHVWEVMSMEFRYYFFTENCSYRLLALLDVVREGSSLAARDNFPVYAIPADTVRVLDAQGVIEQRTFRPSLLTSIDKDIESMPAASLENTMSLLESGFETTSASAAELELAIDILEFRGESESPRSRQLLRARSRLPPASAAPIVEPVPPEQGHDSARLEFSAGRIEDTETAWLALRPSYHDLLDPVTGYVEGTAIEIMSLRLALLRGKGVELDELALLRIESLPAWRRWYRPWSWSLDASVQRHQAAVFGTSQAFNSLQFRAGAGATWRLQRHWQLHALLLSDNQVSSRLEDSYTSRLGVRLTSSILLPRDYGRLLFRLENLPAIAGQDVDREHWSVAYQFEFRHELALRLSLQQQDIRNGDEQRWALSLFRYF